MQGYDHGSRSLSEAESSAFLACACSRDGYDRVPVTSGWQWTKTSVVTVIICLILALVVFMTFGIFGYSCYQAQALQIQEMSKRISVLEEEVENMKRHLHSYEPVQHQAQHLPKTDQDLSIPNVSSPAGGKLRIRTVRNAKTEPPRQKKNERTKNSNGQKRRHATNSSRGSKGQTTPSGRFKKQGKHKNQTHRTMPAFHATISQPGSSNPSPGWHPSTKEGGPEFVFGPWHTTDVNKSKIIHLEPDGYDISVKKAGNYFIYAQILFYNAALESHFSITKKGHHILMTCVSSVSMIDKNLTAADNARSKTCYTAGVHRLEKGDYLRLTSNDSDAISVIPESNFIGLFRV